MNELNTLNYKEKIFNQSLEHIAMIKQSKNEIKNNFVLNAMNILLKKQKMKNLIRIHNFLKNSLFEWTSNINKAKEYKHKKQYDQSLSFLGSVEYDINNWQKQNQEYK